jgi:hypothetical protein
MRHFDGRYGSSRGSELDERVRDRVDGNGVSLAISTQVEIRAVLMQTL